MNQLYSLIQHNCQKLVEFRKNIHTTFESRDQNEESYKQWSNACSIFHENYNELSFPGGLKEGINNLKKADSDSIEKAIVFLEVNPYFFRSGYIKEEILSILKKINLNNSQKERLQTVVLNIIDNYFCREFHYYCRLAKNISSEVFMKKLEKKCKSDNQDIAKRAKWVRDFIGQEKQKP